MGLLTGMGSESPTGEIMTEIDNLIPEFEKLSDILIESFRSSDQPSESGVSEFLSALEPIKLCIAQSDNVSKRLSRTLVEIVFILAGQTKPNQFRKNEILSDIFDAVMDCLA